VKTSGRFDHPFLTLCLSMAWVSIAAEAAHFTDGRYSAARGFVLMGIVAGLAVYCIAFMASRKGCDRVRRHAPVPAALMCVAFLFFDSAPVALFYGVAVGFFLAAAVNLYLPRAATRNRLLKIGLSAGIYTTTVYPFGVAYTLLEPFAEGFVLRTATFLLLAAGAAAIYFLQAPEPKGEGVGTARPAKGSLAFFLMIGAVVALAFLNHLLNSGVLEQNGGTPNAPLIFFVNVALRLPMGALMGFWADRGRWHVAVGFPLVLMIGGCAVSLFAGGIVGDYAMLSVFNCGGAAIVMLVHILGMQTALWRNHNAVAACFGSLMHFTIVAFFGAEKSYMSPQVFGESWRQPLTFAVIIAGLLTFWLIIQFLTNEQIRTTIQDFLSAHGEAAAKGSAVQVPNAPRTEASANASLLEVGLTPQEQRITLLLMEGYTNYEVSRKLHMLSGDVGRQVKAIREKIGGTGGVGATIEAIAQDYGLTKRERDMLGYLMRSAGNGEIASELFISEETVRIHVRNLMRKLPVQKRAEVGAWVASREKGKGGG
jgi:DNA-binding CsgD family transcriptional regulator